MLSVSEYENFVEMMRAYKKEHKKWDPIDWIQIISFKESIIDNIIIYNIT